MTSKPPIINPPFGGYIAGDGQWQPGPDDSEWDDATWRGLVGTEGVRFKVEVAQVNLSHINRLGSGPGDDYFYNDPESDYNDAWYSLDDIDWQDITSRVDRFSVSRGRDALATGFRPGTASITVHNDDGAFNPLRGRVIVGNQTLRPGRWIRFSGRRSTDIEQPFIPLWVGRIDTLGDTYQDAAFKSYSVWSCLDYMSALEQNRKPPLEAEDPTTPGQFTDERVRYIWDVILDNDPAFVETDPGTFTMKGTDFPGSKMNQITQAVKAEGGDFYVAKNGVMKFRNRTWLEDGPTPEGEVQFNIGTIADGHKVVDVKTSWDANRILNYITMQREKKSDEDDPGRIVVTDSTSVAIYAARTLSETSLQNEFDDDVNQNAVALLDQNAFDSLRIDEVTLWADDMLSAQNLLRVELGWRVAITVNTGLGWSYSITAWVNGITHNVDASGWSVALRLDNTDRSNPLLGGAYNDAFSAAFDLKETV